MWMPEVSFGLLWVIEVFVRIPHFFVRLCWIYSGAVEKGRVADLPRTSRE